MIPQADFQSMALEIARKYWHFGMAQTDIEAALTAMGTAVASDAALGGDVTVRTPEPGLTPGSFANDLDRELRLLVNKGRNSPGAAAMGVILTDLGGQPIAPEQ